MKDSIQRQAPAKFGDPLVTATGEARAVVALTHPETLWFNTGTLCNITCLNCYIASSPTNDSLVYLSEAEVVDFLDQIGQRAWDIREIGFTGGEPFMNPAIIGMARRALERGFEVLVLTNAMQPMMRKSMREGLRRLHADFGQRLTLRVSLDHWSAERHDAERGAGSFERTLAGMRWLSRAGIRMTVAGRSLWGTDEGEDGMRSGYAALYLREGFAIDPFDPAETVLFPEMDATAEVPEITTACWGILNKSPDDVMCAASRMVVKRKGADAPVVVSCTLLPDAAGFELGTTLEDAERPVRLNHPHCAKFCVLGGGSCSR